jgi:hypothetical protein
MKSAIQRLLNAGGERIDGDDIKVAINLAKGRAITIAGKFPGPESIEIQKGGDLLNIAVTICDPKVVLQGCLELADESESPEPEVRGEL